MGYQRKKRFRPIDNEYGSWVGGYRYKKYRPEPLAVTVLKFAIRKTTVNSSPQFLLHAILKYIKSIGDKPQNLEYINRHRLYQSLQYLKRKHFISFPGKGKFVVTPKGRARFNKFKLDKIEISEPARWDKKWRLLTFDIPEEKAHIRNYFRKRLKEIGFYHFQRSVFIIPHPCEREIDIMCEELGITSSVHLLLAGRFEGDGDLAKRYNLMI